ncbi:cellobiose dehydrogenase [Colletotrichum paranaense]|uniref:Cellobiose dehydrogenase n=1 Tax=Colletotrichum paranaense TaxID=1914294 RepID=A0ABQ9STT8_9PEZI|nr:cellobiose dehydrogenase [Colletotrichum paranaense]KAK1542421.1 cellobiose dehydrogenase [Colletotrichum paranaense]
MYGGPGGIVTADKLSASGKSVLLIEREPPSSFRWGGSFTGTYGKIALASNVWMLFPWQAVFSAVELLSTWAFDSSLQSLDWDTQFSDGWKAKNLSAVTNRAFRRVPWTDVPCKDGVLHNRQTRDLMMKGLVENGWNSVKANDEPDAKRRTVSQSEYFYQHGERGGLLETHLVSVAARGNVKLWTNTLVTRVERRGDSVSGVQVESAGEGGYDGTIKLAVGDRVILSAGVFGSAKILFRSGIGPKDQLETAQKTEGDVFIDSTQWIDLPVGHNLDDHVNTNILFEYPGIANYDFNSTYDNPSPDDAAAYLCEITDLSMRDGLTLLTDSDLAANRSGILTQAAPDNNPIFWDAVKGEDGIERGFQWMSYVSGPHKGKTYNTSGMAAALGLGKTSRGRATINSSLIMNVSVFSYFNDEGNLDFVTVVTTVSRVIKAIPSIPGATMINPAPSQDVRDYVQKLFVDIGRTANHWVGTTRLGTDSALEGGKPVVDLNAQVYGTKSLHIVDAGILNGIFTANSQAGFVIAAEKVAKEIIKLHG